MGFSFGNLGGLLSKSTNQFYGSLFNKNTLLGKINRTLDPAGRTIADDATGQIAAAEAAKNVAPEAAPVVMPDADGEAVAAARRRKMAAMKNRGGRASTILGGEDRLGG